MAKVDKRWLAASAAGVLVVGAGVALLVSRHGHDGSPGDARAAAEAGGGKWRGFAAGVPGMPGAEGAAAPGTPGASAADPTSPEAQKQQVDNAMEAWRNAILYKDADTVITVDRAFAEDPSKYTPALAKSAENDPNERVRAFSTRVLGKMHAPDLAELFQKLLEDKSPYVRQNAAWALGELGRRPDGRQAAQRALAELRRVETHDAAKDVRVEAGSALKRLQ